MPGSYRSLHVRLAVLGVPLVLGLLELEHPALLPGENISETLAPIAAWWTALHVVQIPLFALLGLAVWILVRDLHDTAARISRWAIAVFIVVYPAFDAAVGVASGILVQAARDLGAQQPAALEAGLQAVFWGPVTGSLALLGALSWLIALLAAAWSWHRAGAPYYAAGALALAGLFLAISHVRPFGPLACLAFVIGAGWVVFRGGHAPHAPEKIGAA